MTTRHIRTIKGAAHWASAIINGDYSGLDDGERVALDAWLVRELEDGESIVDVGEPFFSWYFRLHTGMKYEGGDLAEYTVIT